MSFKWPSKSPTEVQDYSIDWSRLLEPTTAITGLSWTISYSGEEEVSFPVAGTVYGLTNNAQNTSGKITTIFLANGVLNRVYKLTCQITDSLDRITERSVTISIRDR
jgi:hypothetical protein